MSVVPLKSYAQCWWYATPCKSRQEPEALSYLKKKPLLMFVSHCTQTHAETKAPGESWQISPKTLTQRVTILMNEKKT